jgi:hypothetical protein
VKIKLIDDAKRRSFEILMLTRHVDDNFLFGQPLGRIPHVYMHIQPDPDTSNIRCMQQVWLTDRGRKPAVVRKTFPKVSCREAQVLIVDSL